MAEDRKLSEHLTLYELTKTNRANLQAKNREVSEEQIEKLSLVAALTEEIIVYLGVPVDPHSAYRCQDLNRAVGSSDRSQHLLCEAIDFVPMGLEIGNAFRMLWKLVRDGKLKVGQLIFETAERSYGSTSWIHASLGAPFRPIERCNQVLRMEHGKYTMFTPEANSQ